MGLIWHTETQLICHWSCSLNPQRPGNTGAPDAQRATTKGTRWCVLCPGHVADLTLTNGAQPTPTNLEGFVRLRRTKPSLQLRIWIPAFARMTCH